MIEVVDSNKIKLDSPPMYTLFVNLIIGQRNNMSLFRRRVFCFLINLLFHKILLLLYPTSVIVLKGVPRFFRGLPLRLFENTWLVLVVVGPSALAALCRGGGLQRADEKHAELRSVHTSRATEDVRSLVQCPHSPSLECPDT